MTGYPRASTQSQIAAIDTVAKGMRPKASGANALLDKQIEDAKATLAELDRDKGFLNACRKHREAVTIFLATLERNK